MGRRVKHTTEHETRRRLIDAAGALFAEKGFDAITVRDICDKAGTNIASVNYHFSGKMELYEATLRFALVKDEVKDGAQTATSAREKISAPEERLLRFIQAMLNNSRMTDSPEWFPKLLRREMLFPTSEFHDFALRLIRHDFERISALVEEIIPKADSYSVKSCALMLYEQAKSIAMESPQVLASLFPELKLDKKGSERIARHITETTIAGMRAGAKPKKSKKV